LVNPNLVQLGLHYAFFILFKIIIGSVWGIYNKKNILSEIEAAII